MGIERFLKKIIILLIFLGGLILFFAFGGDQYLSFDHLKANRDRLVQYTDQNYWTMAIGAGLIYTTVTALSLPLASGLSLMIGYLFGLGMGMAIILISATVGATLVFLGARYVFGEIAQRRIGKRGQKLMNGFQANSFHYLLFLRLVPLFPFWLVNLVSAFTPIRTRTYIIATAIGIAPGCFVFTNLGQSIAQIDSLEGLISLQTFGALALLGIFALIPVIIKKIYSLKGKEAFSR